MLGILCGLESEAKIAREIKGALVACAAARPGKARALARELLDHGATRLMSFGVAGGLTPGHAVGSLFIGGHVTSDKGSWHCDSAWNNTLANKLPHALHGGVWGSETLVPTADAKRKLFESSGCAIVDMESQCAAEVASAARVPFTVLRAVCDAHDMNVPQIVMDAIKPNGGVDTFRIIRHVVRRPSAIRELSHVGRGMNRALRALKHSRSAF